MALRAVHELGPTHHRAADMRLAALVAALGVLGALALITGFASALLWLP